MMSRLDADSPWFERWDRFCISFLDVCIWLSTIINSDALFARITALFDDIWIEGRVTDNKKRKRRMSDLIIRK